MVSRRKSTAYLRESHACVPTYPKLLLAALWAAAARLTGVGCTAVDGNPFPPECTAQCIREHGPPLGLAGNGSDTQQIAARWLSRYARHRIINIRANVSIQQYFDSVLCAQTAVSFHNSPMGIPIYYNTKMAHLQ